MISLNNTWLSKHVDHPVFGQENKIGRFLKQKARLANLVLFTPIILIGILLNLNDNMTLIAGKDENT